MPRQPAYDEPLDCALTPHEILNILAQDSGFYGYESRLDDADQPHDLRAVNQRTGFMARYAEYDSGSTLEMTVELKVGKAFVGCSVQVSSDETPMLEEWARARMHQAFVRAAALIGLRVEPRLVVV